MLKKLATALMVGVVSVNTFAAALNQTLPWGPIRSANAPWFINNPTGIINISFTVNRTLTGRPGVPSDAVTFLCDRSYLVKPGQTVSCRLTQSARGEFQIAPQDFSNGSEGYYTIS